MTEPTPDEAMPGLDEFLDEEPPSTRWPTVIGVISLIYASLGLLCGMANGAWIAFLPKLPPMFRGGVVMPGMLRVTAIAQLGLALVLGIIMLMGSIRLLRRQRSGVGLLKTWAVARLLLLVISVAIGIFTGPAQVAMQRSMQEFQNEMLREAGRLDRIKTSTDEQLWRKAMIQVGIGSAVVAVYPLFLGFYLARRPIADETARWP